MHRQHIDGSLYEKMIILVRSWVRSERYPTTLLGRYDVNTMRIILQNAFIRAEDDDEDECTPLLIIYPTNGTIYEREVEVDEDDEA